MTEPLLFPVVRLVVRNVALRACASRPILPEARAKRKGEAAAERFG